MTYPFQDPNRRPKRTGETFTGSTPRHVYQGVRRWGILQARCVTCGQSPCCDAQQEAARVDAEVHPRTVEDQP